MKGKVDIMKENILGRRINELRKERGITQEELGRAVGVSGQAVSKWECGGTPDAELIPSIADYFQVTIETLFGREELEKEKPDVSKLLMERIMSLPFEERMEAAYDFCWIMQQAICLAPVQNNIFSSRISREEFPENKDSLYSRLLCNTGFTFMRIEEEQHYFLLMPEPTEGFNRCLKSDYEYQKFFRCLGSEHCIRILMYLYTTNFENITAEYLSELFSLSVEDMNTALALLKDNELIVQKEVKVGINKTILAYYATDDAQIVPFLIFANEFIKPPQTFMFQWGDRDKPALS
jgi:transcriptional regulator with XRE-family HTH domain